MIPFSALRLARPTLAAVAALAVLLSVSPGRVGAAGSLTIRIGSTLSPSAATVAAGTRVTWTNTDGDRHRVRSRSGPVEFDSGNIEPGRSWSITLSVPGSYPYLDDRERDDPRYHGSITVTAAGLGAVAPPAAPGGGSTGGAGGGSTAGVPVSAPSSASVVIGDRVFRPTAITIAAGGNVTWRNADDRAHTATGQGGSFDTGVLQTGGSVRTRFATAGTFAFLCAIHPEMQGTVRVVAARAASAAPPAAPAPTPTPSPTSSPDPTSVAPHTGAGEASPSAAGTDQAVRSGPVASQVTAAPAEATAVGSARAASSEDGGPTRAVLAIVGCAVALALFGGVIRGVGRP